MAFQVKFSVNQSELARMLRSPSGTVGRFINRLAIETAMEARANAPVKSGKLRSSIVTNRGVRNSMEVTANTSYALAVHEGTKAHVAQGNPIMKFPSKKQGGRMIYAATVQMPATKGNPFLVKALKHVISMRT